MSATGTPTSESPPDRRHSASNTRTKSRRLTHQIVADRPISPPRARTARRQSPFARSPSVSGAPTACPLGTTSTRLELPRSRSCFAQAKHERAERSTTRSKPVLRASDGGPGHLLCITRRKRKCVEWMRAAPAVPMHEPRQARKDRTRLAIPALRGRSPDPGRSARPTPRAGLRRQRSGDLDEEVTEG
jgi:hypothetical protein